LRFKKFALSGYGKMLQRRSQIRIARFFLVQHTKTGKNIPNNHKNIPNVYKIYEMAVK
jgi:hypothetical protein